MALRLACPSCRSEIAIDQGLAGREVACPRCGARFTAPSIRAAPPMASVRPTTFAPLDDPPQRPPALASLPHFDQRDEFDISSVRADVAARWKTTVVGLGMMFWATIAIVGTMLPLIVTAAIAGNLEKRGQPPGPEQAAVGVIALGLVCVLLLLAVLYYIGMCLCCGAPAESGAKGRAITAVVLSGIFVVVIFFVIVFVILNAIGARQQGREPITPGMAVVIGLIFTGFLVAIFIYRMLFHRAVALHFGNRPLGRAALFYLFTYLAVTVLGVMLTIITADPPGNPAAGLTVLFNLLTNTALLVWFLVILRRTRTTIVAGVRGGAEA
jgi:predicted Zn finger-like uncharacterized protein